MSTSLEQLREKIFSKYRKDTWEIKTIGEIAIEIVSGSGVTRDQLGTGDYPAIKCGDINSSLPLQFKECISFVDLNLLKKPKYFEHGDLLLSNMGGEDTVGTPVVYFGKDKCLAGDHVIVIKTDQNTKFLAYILSSNYAKAQIKKLAQKSTVYDLYVSKIKQIQIPLPSPEIQQEIVEFLDKYIELERELEMRKKQYEYYRDNEIKKGIEELKWEIKKMEEIATDIYIGSEVRREELGSGDHPTIKCGDVTSGLPLHFTKCISFINPDLVKRKKYFEHGDILIGKIGDEETSGKACAYLGNEKCLLGDAVYALKHNQNPKFLAFVLSTEYVRRQIRSFKKASTVFNFFPREIKQIQIPLPPLDEQTRVVENLDKLYRIVHDLREGIPFLIQKNREIYECYRDLLLEK